MNSNPPTLFSCDENEVEDDADGEEGIKTSIQMLQTNFVIKLPPKLYIFWRLSLGMCMAVCVYVQHSIAFRTVVDITPFHLDNRTSPKCLAAMANTAVII